MKTQNKIYWQEALEAIRRDEPLEQEGIDFNQEQIPWEAAQEFNRRGYEVPEALIDYADEYIDFTDIPEINEESLEDGTYRMTLPVALDYDPN